MKRGECVLVCVHVSVCVCMYVCELVYICVREVNEYSISHLYLNTMQAEGGYEP